MERYIVWGSKGVRELLYVEELANEVWEVWNVDVFGKSVYMIRITVG